MAARGGADEVLIGAGRHLEVHHLAAGVVFVGVELVCNLQQYRCAVLAVDVARINVLRISVGCVDARVIEIVVDVVEIDFMPFVTAEGDAVVIGTVYPSPLTGVAIR